MRREKSCAPSEIFNGHHCLPLHKCYLSDLKPLMGIPPNPHSYQHLTKLVGMLGRSGMHFLIRHMVLLNLLVSILFPDNSLDVQEAGDQDAAMPTKGQPSDKSVPWPLKSNEDGLPIFPPIKDRTLPEIKQIVRSFLSLTYRLLFPCSLTLLSIPTSLCIVGHASNNKRLSVPWTHIRDDPEKFFDSKYLPDGVILVEVSKMKSEALQSCIWHWYKRQEAGECPFEFKFVLPSDSRPRQSRAAKADDSDEEIELPVRWSSTSPSPPSDWYASCTCLYPHAHVFAVPLLLFKVLPIRANPRHRPLSGKFLCSPAIYASNVVVLHVVHHKLGKVSKPKLISSRVYPKSQSTLPCSITWITFL